MKPIILSALLLAASSSAQAQTMSDLAMLDRAIADFTGAAIGKPGGATQPVDRRLRLAHCAAPPALNWYGTGHDTVQVRCPDPGSWRFFVALVAEPAASAQPAVMRGEAVTIAVEGDAFTVTQPGEALDPGSLGAWIRVRSSNASAQPFRAKVIRPGLVQVQIGNPLP